LKIARKVPDLVEPYLNKLKGYLADRDHGVLIAAVAFIAYVCKDHKDFVRQKVQFSFYGWLMQSGLS